MANKDKAKSNKTQPKGKGGKSAKSEAQDNRFTRLGKRLSTFFHNQHAELKRVVWPDKKKLSNTTAVVLAITLGITALIWVTDTILRQTLIATGFDIPREHLAAVTEPLETTAGTTAAATDATVDAD